MHPLGECVRVCVSACVCMCVLHWQRQAGCHTHLYAYMKNGRLHSVTVGIQKKYNLIKYNPFQMNACLIQFRLVTLCFYNMQWPIMVVVCRPVATPHPTPHFFWLNTFKMSLVCRVSPYLHDAHISYLPFQTLGSRCEGGSPQVEVCIAPHL
jgi:hypothetical protein